MSDKPKNENQVSAESGDGQTLKVVYASLVAVEAVRWEKDQSDAVLLSLELRQSKKVFDFALDSRDGWEALKGITAALAKIGRPGADQIAELLSKTP